MNLSYSYKWSFIRCITISELNHLSNQVKTLKHLSVWLRRSAELLSSFERIQYSRKQRLIDAIYNVCYILHGGEIEYRSISTSSLTWRVKIIVIDNFLVCHAGLFIMFMTVTHYVQVCKRDASSRHQSRPSKKTFRRRSRSRRYSVESVASLRQNNNKCVKSSHGHTNPWHICPFTSTNIAVEHCLPFV